MTKKRIAELRHDLQFRYMTPDDSYRVLDALERAMVVLDAVRTKYGAEPEGEVAKLLAEWEAE